MLSLTFYYKPSYWRIRPKVITGLGEVIFQWLFFQIDLDVT